MLVKDFITRSGVPLESIDFRKNFSFLGLEKTRTTPLHPRSDDEERFNKTIKNIFSKRLVIIWHIERFLWKTTKQTQAKKVFGKELLHLDSFVDNL